jgi:acetate kinase
MRVLVVNAGSSSVKLRLLDAADVLVAEADIDAPRAEVDEAAIREWVASAGPVDAVGHRIVHGGERFRSAVRIDDDVVGELRALTDLAPLHQPKSLAALDAVRGALPRTPAVACFDTAFHATMPPEAATYAVPRAWRERWGARRYGFHGLSHAYAARRAVEMAPGVGRLVTCHLGAGASLCAVHDGRSVDTTMGFTPLEGLVMATRSGSVDPGLLLWLLEREQISVAEAAAALEHESGLLALAGTADMREVLDHEANSDPDARLAFGVYVHRLRAGIAAMVASLGSVDAIVFTGGVGERSARVREVTMAGLGFLAASIDRPANAAAEGDADVSAWGAIVRTLVVAAREDLEIARQVREVLG